MSEQVTTWYRSEIGLIAVTGSEAGITGVCFIDEEPESMPASTSPVPAPLAECVRQLDEYFRGERRAFSLLLAPAGTAFQRQVWSELERIPYGTTISYSDLASRLNRPRAVRAVGHANGQNPIWIIIPCHRVIGKNGDLTGYAGGIWRKRWLLNHESE